MNDLIWYLGWFTVACISLYLINRQRKSFDAEEVTNQEPTVMDLRGYTGIKAPDSTEFGIKYIKKLKDSAERERKTFDRKVLDGDIIVPEGIKSRDILQIRAALDETDPMHFHRWTEFKERNPELFHQEYPLTEKEVFYWTFIGSVLNGILFHQENDAVIHYTLEGNIPPNGDYIISGILNGKVLNVTSFKLADII